MDTTTQYVDQMVDMTKQYLDQIKEAEHPERMTCITNICNILTTEEYIPLYVAHPEFLDAALTKFNYIKQDLTCAAPLIEEFPNESTTLLESLEKLLEKLLCVREGTDLD